MPKSTITAKYQTTVPKEVREKLGARPGDVLQWEVAGDPPSCERKRSPFRTGLLPLWTGPPLSGPSIPL